MVEDIETVIEVAAPREVVWRALTDPALVPSWMGCLRFQPTAGHVFYMQPDRARREADDVADAIQCRIEVVDPPRRLIFAWTFPETPDTRVRVRLSSIAGGTHVRVVHEGWDQFEPDEIVAVREGLARGWHAVALPGLRRVAESLAA